MIIEGVFYFSSARSLLIPDAEEIHSLCAQCLASTHNSANKNSTSYKPFRYSLLYAVNSAPILGTEEKAVLFAGMCYLKRHYHEDIQI
jgi:hypothetical protein